MSWFWQRTRRERREQQATRKSPRKPQLALETLEERACPAITLQFDYSLDVNNFFTPDRRAVLQRAGDAIATQFTDTLDAIPAGTGNDKWDAVFTNPGTGAQSIIPNLVVPANTVIIYAGGRDLGVTTAGRGGPGAILPDFTASPEFVGLLNSRGQAGALANPSTDFSLWGGALEINTANPSPNAEDYYALFQHEVAHVLGFGTAGSWANKIVNGRFTGTRATAAYDVVGESPPVEGGQNPSHWQANLMDGGSSTRMGTSGGNNFTGLDRAAMGDIGWQLLTDTDGTIATARPTGIGAGQVTFTSSSEDVEVAIDADLYKFEGSKDDKITLITASRDGQPTVDTFLRIFDGTGQPIATKFDFLGNPIEFVEDDNSGPQAGYSRLVFTLPADGVYYAGVSAAPNKGYLATEAYARADAGKTGSYSLTITKQVDVTLTTTKQSIAENANPGQVNITVQLASVQAADVKIPFTLGGTGQTPDDFTAPNPREITIPAGQTVGTLTLTLVNDTAQEDDETIIVTLQDPTDPNVKLGALKEQTITILDDDRPLPTIGFTISAPPQGTPEGDKATFQVEVTLSAPSPQRDVTITLSLAGTAARGFDYTLDTTTLTIPKGQTTGKFTLTVIDETNLELDETAILNLASATNATIDPNKNSYKVTILDDDRPTVKFTSASSTVTEGATTFFTVEVQLSKAAPQVPGQAAFPIDYALSGTATKDADFALLSGNPFFIFFGETKGTLRFTLTDDALDEGPETLILTLKDSATAVAATQKVFTVNIVDNDRAPTIKWQQASQSVNEKAGNVTLLVELSNPFNSNITVPVQFLKPPSTTTNGDDFVAFGTEIMLFANQTTGSYTVGVIDDTDLEPAETAVFKLGTPQGGGSIINPDTFTLTILDGNGMPKTVQFTTTAQDVNEGATGTLTVQLSAAAAGAVTIPYTITGTATNGTDFTLTPATPLTIAAGQTSGTLNLSALLDQVADPDETVIVTLGTPSAGVDLGQNTKHTITIKDVPPPPPPTLQFTTTSQNVDEGKATKLTLQLSAAAAQAVTIPYTVTGTATNGTDFNLTPATPLTIAAGQTSATLDLTALGDLVLDPDETVIVTLGTPTNATLGAQAVHTATIKDVPPLANPTLQFTTTSQNLQEGKNSTVLLQLSGPPAQAVTVNYTLTGTATNGLDFTLTPDNPLTIPAGTTSLQLNVNALVDQNIEPDETVIITLTGATNGTLGTNVVHTVTIKDVPPPPAPTATFTVVAQQGTEGETKEFLITVQLSAAPAQDVFPQIAFSGDAILNDPAAPPADFDYTVVDFNFAPFTVGIAKNTTQGTFKVTIRDDAVIEADEKAIFTLQDSPGIVVGANKTHTLTIRDNDVPSVQLTSASQNVDEGKSTTVTVQLSAASPNAVTIPFTLTGTATNGTDFTLTPASPLVIAAGQTTGTLTLTALADAAIDPNQTVIITLGTPTNATLGTTKVHTATIIDKTVAAAKPGTLAFGNATASIAEDKGTLSIPITRTNGSEGAVAVTYTVTVPTTLKLKNRATPGADFTGSLTGTITFAAGETTKNVDFAIKTDDLVEVTESFVVTLSAPTGGATLGGQTTNTVSITDVNLPIVADAAPDLKRLELAGSGFGKSEEHYKDFVTKAYARFLNRQPDAAGFTYWVGLMQLYETSKHAEGLRQEQIEAGFINSVEYKGLYGGTAGEAWVRGIYKDLLARPADQNGVNYWLGQLQAGVEPTQVALGFTASDERLRNRVTDTYRTLLEREPDDAGLAYWIAIFKNGGTTEDINSGFVGSIEYYNKANSSAGNPAKWIRDAYLDILFRPASVAEFDYWQRFLKG